MTKEEAIKTCKQVRKYFKGGKLATDDTDAIYGALTEAIDALQAHPTLDDVSNAYENGYQQGKFEAQQWIPFRQRKNPVTELFEWDEPLPKEGQHILVTILMRGHEPVQDDYWYVDGTVCYLDSGYDIGTEAVAWMPLPEPYKEDNMEDNHYKMGKMLVDNFYNGVSFWRECVDKRCEEICKDYTESENKE